MSHVAIFRTRLCGPFCRDHRSDRRATSKPKMNRGRTVLSLQMIFDVIGYLLASGRKIKQLASDDRITCPARQLPDSPIDGSMLA